MFFRNDLASDFRRIPVRNPIELRYQLRRPDVRRGVAMAFQAKRHVQRLILVYFDHLVDAPMTANATHARRHVRRVIKINKIRKTMNLHPGNRLARLVALPDQLQPWAGRLHAILIVAVHARFRRRNRGIGSLINRKVAIIAVKPELSGVQFVAVRNRLNRLIAGVYYRRIRQVGVGTNASQSAEPQHGAGNL